MKRIALMVAAGLVGVGLVVLALLLLAPKSPIAPSVIKRLTSTLLVPAGEASIRRDTARYDAQQKLLVFTTVYVGKKLVVSEQPTPEQFTDIPETFKKVVEQMGEYLTFDANIGTVYLTRPKQLGGKQAAVLNAKGTLMFVKPDTDLTDDQWRLFFKQTRVQD